MMKKLIALCLSLSLLLTPALAIKGEVVDPNDLPLLPPQSSTWAQAEIMAAQEAGLLVDSLGPDFTVNITREQFAELAIKLVSVVYGEGPEPAPADTFTDTTNNAILQAYAIGVVNGVGGGKFDPTAATNREQIASMLYRAITYLEKEMNRSVIAADTPSLSAYSDAASVSGWAVAGVGALAANDIMKGSGGTLMPQNPCTIEQSVLLCYRIYTMMLSE